QFGLSKRNQLPGSCRQCEFLFACHGECPRNRFVPSAGGAEVGLNYLCASYKWFFSHIDKPMRKMVDLLAHGRSPAEVMHMLSN
ncbi:MAG: SPASM domain-containing protein, partial [Acidobacteriaceae bacterium]